MLIYFLPHSPSRYHAVLQHAYDGSLWLYDLSSTFGTCLDGEAIETQKFHRLVAGSKIHFGRSQRQYVVAQSAVASGSGRHLESFEELATSAARSGSGRPELKNHSSDLQAALRSAAGVVKSQVN